MHLRTPGVGVQNHQNRSEQCNRELAVTPWLRRPSSILVTTTHENASFLVFLEYAIFEHRNRKMSLMDDKGIGDEGNPLCL